jgi:hypothetical protein
MPPVRLDVLELGHPDSPYGLRGVGEPPTISSTPAIVAAIRAATGRPLTRVPVRPEHIVEVPAPEAEDRPAATAGRAGPPEAAQDGGGAEAGSGSPEAPDAGNGTSSTPDPHPDGG